MVAKHIVPIVVACGLAAVSALASGMADAAQPPVQKKGHPVYNIDRQRDPFTDGARYQVSPADEGRFILVGRDLTGVSAPPGGAPA
ncbi:MULTISPECIES: hypothetical protein [unclassified Cupriavidus]|uniref:hypothetical protein n=1 Tax=unclassified Cupriavidus TaxID=2640874 RepID=UPI0010F59528|nr:MULTISPECIES: hypothetical protein [unclassified Cupriavidus]MWL89202.1 hypothetical protein [Cupriavidus sp. SW-Y-13]